LLFVEPIIITYTTGVDEVDAAAAAADTVASVSNENGS